MTLRTPLILAAIVGLLLPVVVHAQAKKPITHETLWMMKRVGAPVVRLFQATVPKRSLPFKSDFPPKISASSRCAEER